MTQPVRYADKEPDVDEETLREMYYNENKSLPEIGREVGVSHGTIRNWMEHYDMDRRPAGARKLTRDEVIATLKEHTPTPLTTMDAADAMDVSRETAMTYLKDAENHPAVHRKTAGARSAIWWYDPADEPADD